MLPLNGAAFEYKQWYGSYDMHGQLILTIHAISFFHTYFYLDSSQSQDKTVARAT